MGRLSEFRIKLAAHQLTVAYELQFKLDASCKQIVHYYLDKVDAIAARIRKTDATKAPSALIGVVGTHLGFSLINQLVDAWRASAIGSDELTSMLLVA